MEAPASSEAVTLESNAAGGWLIPKLYLRTVGVSAQGGSGGAGLAGTVCALLFCWDFEISQCIALKKTQQKH